MTISLSFSLPLKKHDVLFNVLKSQLMISIGRRVLTPLLKKNSRLVLLKLQLDENHIFSAAGIAARSDSYVQDEQFLIACL